MSEEQQPIFATPRRKTARMSTGGKPPPIKSSRVSKFFDLEAEESGDNTASEGHNTSNEDDGEEGLLNHSSSIPWERTPTPPRADRTVNRKDIKVPESGSTEAKDVSFDTVEQTPSRVTRSKSKGRSGGVVKKWDPKTHQVLDTQGYDQSESDGRAGIATPSMKLGQETPDSQRKLRTLSLTAIKPSGEKQTGFITLHGEDAEYTIYFGSLSGMLMFIFREYEAWKREQARAKFGGDKGVAAGINAGKRQVISSSFVEIDLTKSSLPSPEIEESTSIVQAKTVDKGKKAVKRKRVNSIESVDAPASSPAELFAAKRSEAAASPPKKITKSNDHVEETVLEEYDVKRVSASSLPAQCQVTNRELQDSMTHHVYIGLPKLLYAVFWSIAGTFIAWSSREGPGMFMISEFASSTPDVDFETLWSCFVFVSKEQFVNLARANPLDFSATSTIYSTDMKRWVLEFKERTAICVSIVCVVSSAVTKARHVNPPSPGSKKANKVPVLKFVTGIHLSQDYDRVVGLLRTVFQHPEMHAQLNEDAITFGTKSTSIEKLTSGTRSSATKYRTSNFTSSQDSLTWEDEVPVYDARHTSFRAERDIDNLDRMLPRYENNGGEIPNGSCALVAYSVSQYKKMPGEEEHISFNIRFAVVLAEPK
ncbi:hypothetical protein R3P38DRAFT_2799649 [Favolaschia claudopus]|uniref:Uncharacterized protein n=1 Tax=Favolaschia claudopus TaxID=2862362 RepID=A0AAW0A0P7_9AGAR